MITCSPYISAITVSKVPLESHRIKEKGNFNYSLERLRTIQRQLECISRKEGVDDLAEKPQTEKVDNSELLMQKFRSSRKKKRTFAGNRYTGQKKRVENEGSVE